MRAIRVIREALTPATGDPGPSAAVLLELMALLSLGVAQPLFEVISNSPEFFVARNTTLVDVLLLALFIVVVVPASIFGLEWTVARITPAGARVLHLGVVAVLATLLLLPWVHRSGLVGPWNQIAIATTGGLLVALARSWSHLVRQFLAILGVLALAVPVQFLLGPEVRGALASSGTSFRVPTMERSPTIVFLVFDEFPLNTLLDDRYRIDAGRYPNLASLASRAFWFRNASTVSSQTAWAVPAIASGRYPVEPYAVPTRRYYPDNLFTVLSGRYEMAVFGRFLQLCPEGECDYDLGAPRETFPALLADLSVVYAHIVTPEPWRERLPAVVGDWRGFAKARRWIEVEGDRQFNEREAEFERFLGRIEDEPEGRFYFLHTMLPHMPFQYVGSGHRYRAPDYQGEREGGERLFEKADATYADVVHQRHILQVGFVDRLVGRLQERLREVGIFDDVLVILTSDHGASYREGVPRRGLTDDNYADIMLVPLIVKLPGQNTGYVSDRNVELVDLVPTIADVLEMQLPYDVDGRSLLAFDLPPRRYKTFVNRSRDRVRLLRFDDAVDNSYVGWERKLQAFGAGSATEVYGLGGAKQLLGERVADLPRGEPSALAVELAGTERFGNVELEAEALPLYVRGTLPAGLTDPVAVAVNGVIVATTRSYTEDGIPTIATMIPAAALRAGANQVELFVVEVGEGVPVLRSLR